MSLSMCVTDSCRMCVVALQTFERIQRSFMKQEMWIRMRGMDT